MDVLYIKKLLSQHKQMLQNLAILDVTYKLPYNVI